jgi:hypothetical protein
MVTVRRLLQIIGVIACLLLVGGCFSDDTSKALPTAMQWASDAGPYLNCPGKATTRSVQYYDIAQDGVADAIVDLICVGGNSAAVPDQVEVYPRDGTPTQSNRIARLTWRLANPADQIFLAYGCIYFTQHEVIIVGRKRDSNDEHAAPDLLVSEVATWANGKLTPGRPKPVLNLDELPPGCP